jgi:hypothetical protein
VKIQNSEATKMKVKHTEGPWKFDPDDPVLEERYGYWIDIGPAMLFCDYAFIKNGKELQFNLADARLIAAAPELLAALVELRREIRGVVKFDVKKHYRLMVADVTADNVIAKATETGAGQ